MDSSWEPQNSSTRLPSPEPLVTPSPNRKRKEQPTTSSSKQIDYIASVYFETGGFLSQVLDYIFANLNSDSDTISTTIQTIDGDNVRISSAKSTMDSDIVILMYNTSDLRTFVSLESLVDSLIFLKPNLHFFLLGVHSIPSEMFKVKWPSYARSALKDAIEKRYGLEPFELGTARSVPVNDVVALAQNLGAPWIEFDLGDISALSRVWNEIARLALANQKKANPSKLLPQESVTGWTIAGVCGVAGFRDGAHIEGTRDGTHSLFHEPSSISYRKNHVIVCDTGNNTIRRVNLDARGASTTETLAGSGRPGMLNGELLEAEFRCPTSSCFMKDDSILVTDCMNHMVRRIVLPANEEAQRPPEKESPRRCFSQNPHNCPDTSHQPDHSDEKCSIDSKTHSQVCELSPEEKSKDGRADSTYHQKQPQTPGVYFFAGTGEAGYEDGTYETAKFNFPTCICSYTEDGMDAFLVSDSRNNVIRLLRGGLVSTFAGCGQARVHDGLLSEACFFGPLSVSYNEKTGNILIADGNNNCVRKIGWQTELGTKNKITKALRVSTLAGSSKLRFLDGPATHARFYSPSHAIELPSGEVVVCDRGNNRMRLVFQGQVSTIGGSGSNSNFDGNLLQMNLNAPSQIAMTTSGDFIIADRGNHRVAYGSRAFWRTPVGSDSETEEIDFEKVKWEHINASAWESFDPVRTGKVGSITNKNVPAEFAHPDVLLLYTYLLNPSLLSHYSIRYIKHCLLKLKSEKDINSVMKMANQRCYMRCKGVSPYDMSFNQLLKGKNFLTPSSFVAAAANVLPRTTQVLSVTLTNTSRVPLKWKIEDELQKIKGSTIICCPSSGNLVPSEKVILRIVVNLIDQPHLHHILRISTTILSPPVVAYTPLLISVSTGNLFYAPTEPHTTSNTALDYWEIEMTMLDNLQRFGSGSSASVFKASLFGMPVAVKKWDIGTRDLPPKDFDSEVEALKHLRHPNIVQFIGAKSGFGQAWIVSELADRGSLYEFLRNSSAAERSWANKLKMAIDGATGLKFLHERKIIHRDLKSLNCLVSSDLKLQIADFGCSRQVSNEKMTQGVGSFDWMAPETYSSRAYSYMADIFSYGLVLYELLTETLPNRDLMAVSRGETRPVPADLEKRMPKWSRLIKDCCSPDPNQRPTIDHILDQLKELYSQELQNEKEIAARAEAERIQKLLALWNDNPPIPIESQQNSVEAHMASLSFESQEEDTSSTKAQNIPQPKSTWISKKAVSSMRPSDPVSTESSVSDDSQTKSNVWRRSRRTYRDSLPVYRNQADGSFSTNKPDSVSTDPVSEMSSYSSIDLVSASPDVYGANSTFSSSSSLMSMPASASSLSQSPSIAYSGLTTPLSVNYGKSGISPPGFSPDFN